MNRPWMKYGKAATKSQKTAIVRILKLYLKFARITSASAALANGKDGELVTSGAR